VAFHDSLDDRESNASPFECFLAVQPAEDPEQLIRVPHVEAGTIVPH